MIYFTCFLEIIIIQWLPPHAADPMKSCIFAGAGSKDYAAVFFCIRIYRSINLSCLRQRSALGPGPERKVRCEGKGAGKQLNLNQTGEQTRPKLRQRGAESDQNGAEEVPK